jgi:hypothetical protein
MKPVRLLLLAGCALFGACDLSPQPLPPDGYGAGSGSGNSSSSGSSNSSTGSIGNIGPDAGSLAYDSSAPITVVASDAEATPAYATGGGEDGSYAGDASEDAGDGGSSNAADVIESSIDVQSPPYDAGDALGPDLDGASADGERSD